MQYSAIYYTYYLKARAYLKQSKNDKIQSEIKATLQIKEIQNGNYDNDVKDNMKYDCAVKGKNVINSRDRNSA
jgi:hypothetical protein